VSSRDDGTHQRIARAGRGPTNDFVVDWRNLLADTAKLQPQAAAMLDAVGVFHQQWFAITSPKTSTLSR